MTKSLYVLFIIAALIAAFFIHDLRDRIKWLYGLIEVAVAVGGLIFQFFPADVNPFGSGSKAILLPAISKFVDYMIIFYIMVDGMDNIRTGWP
jgi:hypothetical protein